ncbi:MAG: hypothetical protein KC416_09295 [Myxococcales bacterium]|nr:hypothetical protein [Myxococcales bacterium]
MATSSAIALVAAIVLVVTVPLAARAQERGAGVSNTDDAIAQAHFKAGQGHYKAGRFDEAGTEFLKAYELSKRPALLYNAYVAYRDGGNDEWAAKALRQYLAEEPEVADRPLLEARLVTLEERLAEKARRDAAAAEAAEQEAEETRAAEAQAEADAAGPGPWPWVLVGVGGALVVGGIATGIATVEERLEGIDRLLQIRAPLGPLLGEGRRPFGLPLLFLMSGQKLLAPPKAKAQEGPLGAKLGTGRGHPGLVPRGLGPRNIIDPGVDPGLVGIGQIDPQ